MRILKLSGYRTIFLHLHRDVLQRQRLSCDAQFVTGQVENRQGADIAQRGSNMDACWGGVDDDVMTEALDMVEHAYLYMRRGYRASDDGTKSIPSGHFKVGATCHADVRKRKVDGSLPATSHPVAKWRVPADRVYELERQVHGVLGSLNIRLDNGREWFTWRKVLDRNSPLWGDLDAQERWTLALIDGCLLSRHEPVEVPPTRTRESRAPARRESRTPAQRESRTPGRTPSSAAGEVDALTATMLRTWLPPQNQPPQEMVAALQRAVRASESFPPGMKGRASVKTAKSSRIALNVAASFKRYTDWDGLDVADIGAEPLKRHLRASKAHECRLFGAGSDCGQGSGSQALGWARHVVSISVTENEWHGTDGQVVVHMDDGETEYEWEVEFPEKPDTPETPETLKTPETPDLSWAY